MGPFLETVKVGRCQGWQANGKAYSSEVKIHGNEYAYIDIYSLIATRFLPVFYRKRHFKAGGKSYVILRSFL